MSVRVRPRRDGLVGQVARQEGTDQGVHLIRPIEIRAVAGTSDHVAADASLNGRFASGTDLDAAWRCGLLGARPNMRLPGTTRAEVAPDATRDGAGSPNSQ